MNITIYPFRIWQNLRKQADENVQNIILCFKTLEIISFIANVRFVTITAVQAVDKERSENGI